LCKLFTALRVLDPLTIVRRKNHRFSQKHVTVSNDPNFQQTFVVFDRDRLHLFETPFFKSTRGIV
jgi:hypothetical protein